MRAGVQWRISESRGPPLYQPTMLAAAARSRRHAEIRNQEQHEEQPGQELGDGDRRAGNRRETQSAAMSPITRKTSAMWSMTQPSTPGIAKAMPFAYTDELCRPFSTRRSRKRSRGWPRAASRSARCSCTAASSSAAATTGACSRAARCCTARWTRSSAPAASRRRSIARASWSRRCRRARCAAARSSSTASRTSSSARTGPSWAKRSGCARAACASRSCRTSGASR